MNHITALQATVTAQSAEIAALRQGMSDLVAYLTSDKFSTDNSVNVNDVILRLREASRSADETASSAYMNAVGPRPEPSTTGWRCPECRTSLRSDEYNGNTEAKAEERMRLHWIEAHQVKA